MTNPGLMLVICAPSGAGKSTLIQRLGTMFNFAFSVSCTTRAPRPGEQDGREYHFLTMDEFIRRRDQGYFAEWAEVHGNFYGTPRQATEVLLAQGQDVLFDIDVQGARQLKESLDQGCYVFLFPPSPEVLEQRLRNRGTDSPETIQRRLDNARQEIQSSLWFDYWIINDNLEQAERQLQTIYLAEKTRPRLMATWRAELERQWGAM